MHEQLQIKFYYIDKNENKARDNFTFKFTLYYKKKPTKYKEKKYFSLKIFFLFYSHCCKTMVQLPPLFIKLPNKSVILIFNTLTELKFKNISLSAVGSYISFEPNGLHKGVKIVP